MNMNSRRSMPVDAAAASTTSSSSSCVACNRSTGVSTVCSVKKNEGCGFSRVYRLTARRQDGDDDAAWLCYGMKGPFAILDRERTIAPLGYNRWLVPPAALAVHLSIGQAYAFSVFNIPLSRTIGVTQAAPGDWSLATLGWVFSTAIVFLGLSAALFGSWLERVGQRKAMFASALCFSGGFFVGAVGIALHQFWILLLGYG